MLFGRFIIHSFLLAACFLVSGSLLAQFLSKEGQMEKDMDIVAELLYLAVTDFDAKADFIRAEVKTLCDKYPIYEV